MKISFKLTISIIAFLTISQVIIAQGYLLGPGDVVKITVLNLTEMNGEYKVNAVGDIVLPYLNRVSVQGKSEDDVKILVSNRLEETYLNDPQVLVRITEFRSNPITLIGEVNLSGPIKDVTETTLLQVLSLGGGITDRAGNRVIVIRKSPKGGNVSLEVDLDGLLFEGRPHLNIPIFPGDTVNVPADQPIKVYVTGEVNKPGEYQFSRKNKVLILQLVAAAGGFTDYARQRRVLVRRTLDSGETKEFVVDVKAMKSGKRGPKVPTFFELYDNDVIIVP